MEKTCRQCSAPFEITPDDLAFLDKVSPVVNGKKELIPPPTLCPECRDRRRYVFRNERSLHRRPCELCGKSFISVYAPDKPFLVYCPECYYSDKWDAGTFARDLDFSRPFFEQFALLQHAVPRLGVDILKSENSDYSNISIENKDCYLVFATARSQRCFFTRKLLYSSDCFDCSYGEHLELCYQCLDCAKSYNLLYSENCTDCSFSAFLYDCVGVKNSFLCTNLRNKEYCFRNKQLSRKEYEAEMRSLTNLTRWEQVFRELKSNCIHRMSQNVQAEQCTGNHLRSCKNCRNCYDIYHSQDCAYCSEAVTGLQSSMDCSGVTMESEWDYECCNCSNGTVFTSFSNACRDGNSNLFYCDSVYSSQHLFGCVGSKHQRYRILNKQYTKEEYEGLVPRLISHMRKAGEWGEFFPSPLSPFDYNESVAQEFHPFTKEEAALKGYRWREVSDELPTVAEIIPASQLPDSIDDIPDDILNWAIECEATKRPFKIIKQELEFYRKMRLPVPRFHPDERHRRRMALRNQRKLWKRPCMKCGKEMETTYSPERPEIVYCEQCYLKEVY